MPDNMYLGMDQEELARELNKEQLEAVLATEGPVLILAGAGSGKTRVLTYRTAYLISGAGVKPWNIMALTFTNKAAREMRERINAMTGEAAKNIWVSTFHSTCLKIMFSHASELGYSANFEIADQADQKSLIHDVCKKLDIDTKLYREKALLKVISSAKDELKTPEQFALENAGDFGMKTYVEAYREYQSELRHNNAMDFDDLIMNTVELFRSSKEALEYYQERFRYIMVDEYQDTNTAQFEFIRLLASKYRNLCVVGDDDQSIYRFRGANIYNILDFEKTYHDAKVVKLEQNYRSTGNILETANEVIANNKGRKVKKLWTEAESGSKIHFRQLDTASGEAAYVADDIKKKVTDGIASYSDFAILMRTNVQSKEIEDAFRVRGISYDLVKGLRFWDTKVIKDISAYLLTMASGDNDMRTLRIINLPKRSIGQSSVEKLAAFAGSRSMSLFEACAAADEANGIPPKAASAMMGFYRMLLEIRGRSRSIPLSATVDEIIKETGYMQYLAGEAESTEKFLEMSEYINKLKESLDIYEKEEENPNIVDFMRMNGVEGTSVDKDEAPESADKVLIMTMHNAKGLEFPYVYMTGMEDGLFPSYGTISDDDPMAMEEERRLCYVGITRAKKDLTLTCARQRMTNGETRYAAASRFVKEIPFGMLDMNIKPVKIERHEKFASPQAEKNKRTDFFMNEKPAAFSKRKLSNDVEQKKLDYAEGDRVRHFKFGQGTVLSIAAGGRDYEVTVNFDNAGQKKMFAGFANLKKI